MNLPTLLKDSLNHHGFGYLDFLRLAHKESKQIQET